jgi:DNA-binding SARP family transcriptional activator
VEEGVMIEQDIAGQQDIRDLAVTLLRQGERCAVAGLIDQAEAVLNQVWMMTVVGAPDLANDTAWELACLLAQRGAYIEAAVWFQRVDALPSRAINLWPAARQTMVQMCRALAGEHFRPVEIPRSSRQVAEPLCDPSPELPALNVINLGRLQIIRAGTMLPTCKAHKAVSLFRYLLAQRHRAAHKEALMELFWLDAHPRDARNSLHGAISALRHHLDPASGSYVLFEDDRYAINPEAPIEDDSATFQGLSDEGEQYWQARDLAQAQRAYTQALACYQGDYYLDSCDLTWAGVVQEHLLCLYLSALDHLGQIFISQHRFEQAAECYRQLLERDSYREDAHRQLMRCYSQLGRRCEALRQYERYVAILANDLHLEPMQETRELYQVISDIF